MTRSSFALALLAGLVGVAVAGCASHAAPEEGPDSPSAAVNARDALVQLEGCLEAKGWEVELEGGAIVRDGPPEQSEPFRAAIGACEVELGFDDIEAPEVDQAFAAAQYERQVELRDCLIAEGYSPPELPSEAVYVDQLLVDGTVYSLYSELGVAYDDPVHNACPDPLDTWDS